MNVHSALLRTWVNNRELSEAADEIDRLEALTSRGQCGLCGNMTLTRNPHPDAGKPGSILEVGMVWECVPCNRRALHHASEARWKAEKEARALREELERQASTIESLDLGQRALAEYSKKLEAQVITLRAALEAVDSRLLHVLADWFDSTDRPGRGTEVQESLRQWASVIEAALKGSEQ